MLQYYIIAQVHLSDHEKGGEKYRWQLNHSNLEDEQFQRVVRKTNI